MASKVRVYAKSQKWAALGIVDAYLKMYPHATLEDINKAFPRNLFVQTEGNLGLFATMAEKEKMAAATSTDFDDKQLEEWKRTHHYLTLADGTDIAFTVSMWTKEMFEKIIEQAKLYDIEIAQYDAANKGFGKRGEYKIEFLNGYVPPVPVAKKGIPAWVWAVLGALLAGLILFLLLGKKTETQVVEVEKIVVVHDTLYIQQIAEIEKNFNAAEFSQGKAELSEDAKFVLHDLAKVMKENESITLKILGHTSADGDATYNQKLSEARAKAAVDFMIEREGIAAERLSYEGMGSSQLKNTEDPNASENRRTEFVVVE